MHFCEPDHSNLLVDLSLYHIEEAIIDLFRDLIIGYQLKPWDLHPLVSSAVRNWNSGHWLERLFFSFSDMVFRAELQVSKAGQSCHGTSPAYFHHA